MSMYGHPFEIFCPFYLLEIEEFLQGCRKDKRNDPLITLVGIIVDEAKKLDVHLYVFIRIKNGICIGVY